MADANLSSYKFPSAAGETSERRKVRKGTQSCWECKRRKVRCTLAAPRDVACEGCKRRGTLCVSQEFAYVGTSTSSTRQVGDRLGRVEALVEQLLKNADNSGMLEHPKDSPVWQRRCLQGQLRSSNSNSPDPNGGVPTGAVSTPTPSALALAVSPGELGHETVVRVACTILSQCTPNTAKAWPSSRELCRDQAALATHSYYPGTKYATSRSVRKIMLRASRGMAQRAQPQYHPEHSSRDHKVSSRVNMHPTF